MTCNECAWTYLKNNENYKSTWPTIHDKLVLDKTTTFNPTPQDFREFFRVFYMIMSSPLSINCDVNSVLFNDGSTF